MHAALPVQSAVQPPFGQWIVHELLPPHETVEPVSTVTSHVLPPAQLTVLFTPVESVQSLFPAHDHEQFEVQLPVQFDWPSHVVVQPVPQDESHLSFVSQW